MAERLTELQRNMLRAGTFLLDGWCPSASWHAAGDLLGAGYLNAATVRESQYTAERFTITASGRAALASIAGG